MATDNEDFAWGSTSDSTATNGVSVKLEPSVKTEEVLPPSHPDSNDSKGNNVIQRYKIPIFIL